MVTTPDAKKNIQEKLAQVRKASPSGTVSSGGAGNVGPSGVAGSYQATGGGTTQIVVDSATGKSSIKPYGDKSVEAGRQAELERREQQRQERPAEQAARLSVLAQQQDAQGNYTKAAMLAQQRQRELLAQAGTEAQSAHYTKFYGRDEKGNKGFIGIQTEGQPKPQKDLNTAKEIEGNNGNRGNNRNNLRVDNSDSNLGTVNTFSNKEDKGLATISEYKPSTWEERLVKTRRENEGSFKGIFAGLGATGIYYGKSILKGVTAPFRLAFYTKEVPSTVELVSRPLRGQYAPEIGQALQDNPEQVIGEFAGFSKGAEIGFGKLAPQVKTEKFNVPVESAARSEFKQVLKEAGIDYVEQPKEVTGRVIGIETPPVLENIGIKKSFEVGGVKSGVEQGGLKIGRMDFSKEIHQLPEGEQLGGNLAVDKQVLSPSTSLQTGILKRATAKAAAGVTNPKAALELERSIPVSENLVSKTVTTKSKFIAEGELKTERLNAEGVKVILDVAKSESGQAVIFGSGARRLQIPKEISDFTPRDVDVRLPQIDEAVLTRVKNKVVEGLTKKGYTARASPDKIEAVEVKVGDIWEKAVEFKGQDNSNLLGSDKVPQKVLGFEKEGKPITLKVAGKKYKFTRLSEELRGVTQGVVRVQKIDGELRVFPPEKRIKDIESTIISAKALEKSQVIKRGLAKDIAEFESIYGKARNPSAKPEEALLADFSPASPNKSPKPASSFLGSPVSYTMVEVPKTLSPAPYGSSNSSPASLVNPRTSPQTSPKGSSSSSSKSPNKSPFPTMSPASILSPTTGSPSPNKSTISLTSPISPVSPSAKTSSSSPQSPSPKSSSPRPSQYPGSPYQKMQSPFASVSSAKKKKKALFLAKQRRFGKFKPTGPTVDTPEIAFDIGRIKTEESLGAAFEVIEVDTGRVISPSEIRRAVPQNFYKSRRETGVFIQKAFNRLQSFRERKEIQQSKRIKKIFGG